MIAQPVVIAEQPMVIAEHKGSNKQCYQTSLVASNGLSLLVESAKEHLHREESYQKQRLLDERKIAVQLTSNNSGLWQAAVGALRVAGDLQSRTGSSKADCAQVHSKHRTKTPPHRASHSAVYACKLDTPHFSLRQAEASLPACCWPSERSHSPTSLWIPQLGQP